LGLTACVVFSIWNDCLTAAMPFLKEMPLALKQTLVVVDMQPLLPAANHLWLRQAILGLIEKAKAQNMAIVMLEYLSETPLCYYGETYEELVAAARGAQHFAMRAKADLDGSARVAVALQSMDLVSRHFVVCGINTHACVEATAVGLTKLFPDAIVEVAADACNDYRGNDWSRFASRPNLTVVHGNR
jgi:nicotinamidase-related amidase